MSTYVKAVLKIADGSKFEGKKIDSEPFQEMASKCIEFGEEVFELKGKLFAIIPPSVDKTPIRIFKLPFDLKDFEV